jgi:hypothetical protein
VQELEASFGVFLKEERLMNRSAQLGVYLLLAIVLPISSVQAAIIFEQNWESAPEGSSIPGWLAVWVPSFSTDFGIDSQGVGGSKAAFIIADSSSGTTGSVSLGKSITAALPLNASQIRFTADMIGTATAAGVPTTAQAYMVLYQENDPSHFGIDWRAERIVNLQGNSFQTYGGAISDFTQTGVYSPAAGTIVVQFAIVRTTSNFDETLHIDNISVVSVPEPSAISLAVAALFGLTMVRRNRS